jgi:hypothetical protein
MPPCNQRNQSIWNDQHRFAGGLFGIAVKEMGRIAKIIPKNGRSWEYSLAYGGRHQPFNPGATTGAFHREQTVGLLRIGRSMDQFGERL